MKWASIKERKIQNLKVFDPVFYEFLIQRITTGHQGNWCGCRKNLQVMNAISVEYLKWPYIWRFVLKTDFTLIGVMFVLIRNQGAVSQDKRKKSSVYQVMDSLQKLCYKAWKSYGMRSSMRQSITWTTSCSLCSLEKIVTIQWSWQNRPVYIVNWYGNGGAKLCAV